MFIMCKGRFEQDLKKRGNVFEMRQRAEMSVKNLKSLTRRVLARELYATERVTLNKIINCAACA